MMSSRMFFNEPSITLPPLAFTTPTPSPNTRRRNRGANANPPLLKRKRSLPTYFSDSEVSYPSNKPSLPFLDCESFGTGIEAPSRNSAPSLQLPSISLQPRTKRSRRDLSQPSLIHDQECEQPHRNNIKTQELACIPLIQENDDDTIQSVDAELCTPLKRSSSSRSMLSRTSSMNLTRSVSLQFNLSLMNLAGAAKTNGDSGPLSASTSSLLPKRKSFKQITSSSSAKDIVQIQRESAHRRSPVASTLDYLATAMLFPDVGIGLSI